MKKWFPCVALFALLPASAATIPTYTKVVLSPVYKVDRIFKSMEGPQSSQEVYLQNGPTPELLWLIGFETEMVGADGSTPSLPEFMCHVNLDYDVRKHDDIFGEHFNVSRRLLTLSQGQLSTYFPAGFGIPIMSNEPLSMSTQVLNFNVKTSTFEVRHKVTFYYVRDQELKRPMKPLFSTGTFGMKLLEGRDGHYGMPEGNPDQHGPSCLPGSSAPNAAGGSTYSDNLGRRFTGHWVVKPGREVNHTNVTKYMNLPYNTTLHYVAVHLHPFAESLELRDLTANRTIFESRARGLEPETGLRLVGLQSSQDDKIGLSAVEFFSSQRGVRVYKNHEYDLVSVYNNTSQTDQDSMAVMLLFLQDKEFKKPLQGRRGSNRLTTDLR